MTKTPDQEAHTTATSTAGPIPRQAPFPTHTAGHTVNTGEQNALGQQTDDEDVGNITLGPASGDPSAEVPARPREEPLKVTVKRRLEQEGRWAEIEPLRDDMMRIARKQQKMSKTDVQAWVYAELDRLYPPPVPSPDKLSGDGITRGPSPRDSSQIRGLSDLPEDWPDLPANASLSSEVGWVQANRLRIVAEQPSGATSVHLDQALSPAPSWSALGWLETSIRSYAKYVDVAARATASSDGEAGVVRRERMSIEEVQALLGEMMDDDR